MSILSNKDVNASMAEQRTPPSPGGKLEATKPSNNINISSAPENVNRKPDITSFEYHRQVMQSKMGSQDDKSDKRLYISPSDNIVSPCTAKLTALRNKQAGKVKPKSLFARHSAQKLVADALFKTNTSNITSPNAPRTGTKLSTSVLVSQETRPTPAE